MNEPKICIILFKNRTIRHFTRFVRTPMEILSGVDFCVKGDLNEKEHGNFWRFWDRSKNFIFGFLGVEKYIRIFVSSSRIIQNFEKIDLQNWNFRQFSRPHVIIFWTFFDANLFVGHQLRVHRGSQDLKVKRGQLRSNLKFRPKNSFSMTHIGVSHENFSIYVNW